VPDVAGIQAANSDNLINTGFFKAERLVNMGKHDHRPEPNVFGSDMLGPVHVCAVEIAKSAK
jgi:oligogalacturonide lyase